MILERARRWGREVVANALYYSGLLGLVQRLLRPKPQRSSTPHKPRRDSVSEPQFAILYYHRVGTGGVPLFSGVRPEVFEAQMRFLRQRCRLVSLDELFRGLQNPNAGGPALAITFDDGYRDLYTHAFPILQKYQVPATIFVVVDSIETGEVPWYDRVFLALKVLPANRLRLDLDRLRQFDLSSPAARLQAAEEIVQYLRKLPDQRRREFCVALERKVRLPDEELRGRMLTWEQIRTMHRAGIAFGSHTLTHRVISRLKAAETQREILESKEILERKLGAPVLDFSYPFGQLADCGTAAREWLARGGYRLALTTVPGINKPGADLYSLRRISVGHLQSVGTFALSVSLLFLRSKADEVRTDTPFPEPPMGEAQWGAKRHEAGGGHA